MVHPHNFEHASFDSLLETIHKLVRMTKLMELMKSCPR